MATTRIPFTPARGGQAEQDRFHEQYRATTRSYRQHCGESPADLWPPVDGRFGRDLQMRRDRIRRPFRLWRGWRWPIQASTLLGCLALMAPGIAKAAAGAIYDPLPESRDLMVQLVNQLNFGASIVVGFIISYSHLRPLILQPSSLSKIPQLDNEQLAYLSAGPTRVIELGLASLIRQGVLKVNSRYSTLVLTGQTDYSMSGSAKLVLRAYRKLMSNGQTTVAYADIIDLSHYNLSPIRKFLQSHKLLPKGLAKSIAQCGYIPTHFRIIGMIFGLSKPNLWPLPVFILLPYLMGVSMGITQWSGSGRTLRGDAVFQYYRSTSTNTNSLQRIALLGYPAMTGGRLDELSSIIKAFDLPCG
jgi:uncharacterized protein (TIGR04222 family)